MVPPPPSSRKIEPTRSRSPSTGKSPKTPTSPTKKPSTNSIKKSELPKLEILNSKQIEPSSPKEAFIKELPPTVVIKRGCRDVFFLILFFIYWVGMGYTAYFAIKNGDPTKLV
jgi:hypothetical protein